MHITAQGCRLRNNLYCVEWDVKLYYTYILTDCQQGDLKAHSHYISFSKA